jgi:ribbon-helix-helix CopG family protein
MKRTTVRLPDDLMRQVKRLARETDRTLTQLIEDALRATLARRKSTLERSRISLPTFGEGGLLPGVDLDDSASLLDLMEGPDDPLRR